MGSGYDIVLEHSGLMDGLNIFAGYSSIDQLNSGGTTGNRTATGAGLTYAIGGATVGYQISNDSLNQLAGVNHYDNQAYGVSFAVNDNLTISTGRHEVDMGGSKEDEVSTGFSASYTMGSITVAGHANKTDSQQGVVNQDETSKSVNIGFAF